MFVMRMGGEIITILVTTGVFLRIKILNLNC